MPRFAPILRLLLILCALSASAQSDELDRLVNVVVSLRGGGEAAYDRAVSTLAADGQWTAMDELKRNDAVECRASDGVPSFLLNSILTNARSANRYESSTGNHLNGADSRYSYSLYERTLRKGCSASFTLPERWGPQVIVIVPFDPSAKLLASASGDAPFKAYTSADGIIRLSGDVTKGKTLSLSVTNPTDRNLSYVILNYNSRK